MKRNILSIILFSFLFIGTGFTTNSLAQIKDWKHLGSKKVNYKLDRDVIKVKPNARGYKKLKLKVTGGALNMHKMIVTYGNGNKDVIQLKHNFKKGAESRIIDLKAGARQIKSITFIYDTKNYSRKKAKIHVAGKRA